MLFRSRCRRCCCYKLQNNGGTGYQNVQYPGSYEYAHIGNAADALNSTVGYLTMKNCTLKAASANYHSAGWYPTLYVSMEPGGAIVMTPFYKYDNDAGTMGYQSEGQMPTTLGNAITAATVSVNYNSWWSRLRDQVTSFRIEGGVIRAGTGLECMFYQCTNLTDCNLTGLNVTGTTHFGAMFYQCTSLEQLDVSPLNSNGSTTASMQYNSLMFFDCTALKTLDLSTMNFSGLIYSSFLLQNAK